MQSTGPFHFQTAQQSQLYEKLARFLGPGPAAFYLDAHRMVAEQTPYTSTTHLVAHLLREIESSLRRVLLPYNYRAPAACPKCGIRPEEEGHKKQIEAIAELYQLDESLSTLWIALATGSKEDNGFAAFAHRDALTVPRPLDRSLDHMITKFERVLSGMLGAFERQSLHVFALLDELLSKPQPGEKDVTKFKNRVPANWATYSYFFSRLENPAWLRPLIKKDVFALPPKEVEDGHLFYALWPQAEYLQKMALLEEAQEQVFGVIETVVATDNPYVRREILGIGTLLPAPLVARAVPAMQEWFGTFDPHAFITPRFISLIEHLVDGGEAPAALGLLEASLTALAARDSLTERWDYEQLLFHSLPLFTKSRPQDLLHLLCRLLDHEIYQHYIRYRNLDETDTTAHDRAREASTTTWQRTIEATGQILDQGMNAPLHLLVAAIRKAAEQAIEEAYSFLADVVSLLETHPGKIFCRLALYLLSRFGSVHQELVRLWLMNRPLFKDADMSHEYALLAKVGLPFLPQEELDALLLWIEEGPDLDIYRQNYNVLYQEPPTEEHLKRAKALSQRNWFGQLGDALPQQWRTRYATLVSEYGPYQPEPVIEPWPMARRIPALAIEEYRAMPLEYLLQAVDAPPDEQSAPRAGLARLLTTLIAETPARFADQADRFQGQSAEVVNAALQGFFQAAQSQQPFDWSRVLSLCAWTVEQRVPLVWEEQDHQVYQPEWAEAGLHVAYLLLFACNAPVSGLPLSWQEEIWSILELLTEDPNGPDFESTANEPQRYFHAAINSTRGVALQAAIGYALWLRKHWERDEPSQEGETWDFGAAPEVQEVLERHLAPRPDGSPVAHAIYGQCLPSLVLLDANWTTQHLLSIFPRQPEYPLLYDAAWETYLFQARLSPEVFALLKDEYAAAIERLDRGNTKSISPDTPESHLANHLMILYESGILSIDASDDLLVRFFRNASDELRRSAFAQTGQMFARDNERAAPQSIERFQRLWEWRISEISQFSLAQDARRELAAFGWWMRTDVFPPLWSLQQLDRVLNLVDRIDMSPFVVKRLAAIGKREPRLMLRCLDRLVKSDTRSWGSSEWDTSVRAILTVALQQENEGILDQAKALISSLALRGHTRYLTLLSEAQ